jgi:hypothetical protein
MSDNFEIVVSVDQAFLSRLDAWCKCHPENLPRSAAIRLLAAEALALNEALLALQSKS